MARRVFSRRLRYFFAVFMFVAAFVPEDLRAGGAGVELTLEALSKVPGVTAEQLEGGKELIKNLDYTNMRVFRSLCRLPDITAAQAITLLPTLAKEPFSYDHLQLFEQFCTLDGAQVDIALRALAEMKELDYVTAWSGLSLCLIPTLKAEYALNALRLLREMKEPARWAAKVFFEIKGHGEESVSQGLTFIKALSPDQAWAVEANSKIAGITVVEALSNMSAISRITPDNILPAKAFLGLPGITGTTANKWLTGYFAKPEILHDSDYQFLSPSEKTVLLQAYIKASDHLVRVINNLHSVTNSEGDEISDGQLASYSFQKLAAFFAQFPPETRSRFEARFTALANKGEKHSAIGVLREATAFARMETAKRLSTANIYALMTRVSILYDSSFRLILIPELQKRINATYRKSLLSFMQDVDPENINVANFVSSLSLKARLAMFLPPDQAGQEDVLALVTASAFKDENSLVLFAATFEKLLDGILPGTRNFLVDTMISRAKDTSIFSKQIRTILQYYLEGKPGILGAENAARIRALLINFDTEPLANYIRTPFAEWLQDGSLSSLSVFHGDDDGRNSFVANAAFLLSKGYRPRLSARFKMRHDNFAGEELAGLLGPAARQENGGTEKIFKFLKGTPLVVDFVKTVNNIEISHSVAVFHDSETQQSLLEQFLVAGHEMYAPRGHSYWLNDHILDPLEKLVKAERIGHEELAGKQRFLSIGACGGINIYSELTNKFCNKIDMLGSLGAGKTSINNLYNWFLFETIASEAHYVNWKEIDRRSASIFAEDPDKDYQLPGDLPAMLYKILGKRNCWFRPYEENS
ncbi:MAG: hypothetical protein HY885_08485 [Deltaproteobacteria bacterium]|nr:hypothetical protein [Deltaproteobacteria bacterium]